MIKRTLSLFVALICLSLATYGQKRMAKQSASCPKVYIGTSTGLENPGGLLAFNIDVPITDRFSLGGSAGLSSWGYKAAGEGRFYFSDKCNRGWAIGAGVTYNTGLVNFHTDLPVVVGSAELTKTVTLDLKPMVNAFISGYHFWNLGRRNNRFYLQGGYSIRMTDDVYTVKSSDILTSDSKELMKVLAPGGLMIAAGFSFGLGQ